LRKHNAKLEPGFLLINPLRTTKVQKSALGVRQIGNRETPFVTGYCLALTRRSDSEQMERLAGTKRRPSGVIGPSCQKAESDLSPLLGHWFALSVSTGLPTPCSVWLKRY